MRWPWRTRCDHLLGPWVRHEAHKDRACGCGSRYESVPLGPFIHKPVPRELYPEWVRAKAYVHIECPWCDETVDYRAVTATVEESPLIRGEQRQVTATLEAVHFCRGPVGSPPPIPCPLARDGTPLCVCTVSERCELHADPEARP